MKNDNNESTGQFILYQTEDGKTRIECRFENKTLWLSQALMAELFQTTVPNVNIHIKNILAEGELTEAATIKDYLIVRSEGARQVRRDIKCFSRDDSPKRAVRNFRIAQSVGSTCKRNLHVRMSRRPRTVTLNRILTA